MAEGEGGRRGRQGEAGAGGVAPDGYSGGPRCSWTVVGRCVGVWCQGVGEEEVDKVGTMSVAGSAVASPAGRSPAVAMERGKK